MTNNLHGRNFSAEIYGIPVLGTISVGKLGGIYLCQDRLAGGGFNCDDKFGYEYTWYVTEGGLCDEITNLKILPSALEYHALFTKILSNTGTAWQDDGSYWVVPDEVAAEITAFMDKIEAVDVENLGESKN